MTTYTVLAYQNKKTGKQMIHWDIPKIARAAGGDKLFPEDPAKRAKALSDIELWSDKVVAGIVGATATLEIDIEEGTPYPDKVTGEMQDGKPQNRVISMVFDEKKSKSSVVL